MPYLTLILRALILVLAAAGVYLATPDSAEDVLFPQPIHMYGGERTERGISSDAEAAIDKAVLANQAKVHLVVQFKRIIMPAEETLLESKYDISILEYIPERAYVVAFPADEAKYILEQLKSETPARRGVVNIRAADKLSPKLGDPGSPTFPPHVRAVMDSTSEGLVDRPFVSPPPPGVVNHALLVVHFFADETEAHQAGALLAQKAVESVLGNLGQGEDDQWQVLMPVDYLGPLLEVDAVRWVEPVPRPPVDDLHEVREVAGYDVQPISAASPSAANAGAGLGVTVAQWEKCQPRSDHPGLKLSGVLPVPLPPRLAARVFAANSAPSYCGQVCNGHPCDFHATMVAGIYMGNGKGEACLTPDGNPGVEIGTGECSTEDFQGMAANAKAMAYALYTQTHPVGNTTFAIADLPRLKLQYEDAIALGAVISQNSWGESCDIYSNPGGPFGSSYVLSTAYSSGSALHDTVTSGRDWFGSASGYPGRMLVVASAGNYGDELGIPSLWGSVRVTNSAKNVLSVGNVNTHSLDRPDSWAHLSSGRGPTADGRIAPLLSAPGIKFTDPDSVYTSSTRPQQQTPATPQQPQTNGIRTTYPKHDRKPHTYKASWGTSFSTPVVSGAAALLTETFRNTCSAEPTPMELRALLVHTAQDLREARSSFKDVLHSLGLASSQGQNQSCQLNATYGSPYSGYEVLPGLAYEGPDYVYGYGMVQADKARQFAAQSHFITGEINRGYVQYEIEVNDPDDLEDGKLRVTLAWDDPPWAVNALASPLHGLLLNDLDLELIDPSGNRYLPWVLDSAKPADPATQHTHAFGPVTASMRDTRNTVEQVEVEVGAGQYGTWKIRVRAGQIVRPMQVFTLVSKAIAPAQACESLPADSVEHPLELPDTWLMWWLFWLALVILVLLVIELIRLILGTSALQRTWLHVLAALSLLSVVGALIFFFGTYSENTLVPLGVLLVLLIIVARWLEKPGP